MSDVDQKPIPAAPDTVPNLVQKPPIPREEPDPVMTALKQIMDTQAVHGSRMDTIVESQTDLVTRVTRLEEKAPGSNPPPRTQSGFNAAVRQISQTNESDKDRELAARLDKLDSALAAVDQKTDAQTVLLNKLVAAGESIIKSPTVRRIAYAVGVIATSLVYHYAATHGVSIK